MKSQKRFSYAPANEARLRRGRDGSEFLPSRRRFLLGTTALLLGGKAWADAPPHVDFGPVEPPLSVPDLPVVCSDGTSTSLKALLARRVTAIQLMFTECTTTCPIQGAIFRRAQGLLRTQAELGIQLVSLSIDPQADGPVVLQNWLGHYQARAGWIAAAPRPDGLAAMRKFFGAGTSTADNHTTQVSLIDRKAMLVYRTDDLPDPAHLATVLSGLARG